MSKAWRPRPAASARRRGVRALLLCLVLVLGALGTLAVLVQRSLPRWSGRLAAVGLHRELEIVRDRHGVPHIFARDEADAYFALGFAHAQDRLLQLELNRRLGDGTLSELFGAETLASDRFFRLLGLRHVARQNLRKLDAATRAVLDAYTRGINASLAQGASAPELTALRVAPAPFAPEDCVMWLKLVAFQLGGNVWRELANVRLRALISDEQLAQLLPPYPGESAVPFPARDELFAGLDDVARALLASAPFGPRAGTGSNAWLLAGTRTASGKPLLANDPHLGLSAPSVWYLAHLSAPGLNVIGATMPGMPGVLVGRNDRVAWGFTNTGPDTQDLFVERLAADPTQYETPAGPRPFVVREERIAVRHGTSERLVVRESRHGPILSDLSEEARRAMPAGHVLALSWVALRDDDLTLRFPLHAAHARDAAALREATRDFHSPQQNIMYADVDGATGFVAAGRVPVRPTEELALGRVPVEGWSGRHDWQGFVPFEELPASDVDERGSLVTANQKVTPEGYAHFITSEWEPPYRAERIRALLAEKASYDVRDFERMQLDVASPIARELLPALLDALDATAPEPELIARMRRWDRRMTREALEPLLFETWLDELASALYPASLYALLGDYNPRFLAAVLRRDPDFAAWCQGEDSVATSCEARVRAAYVRALGRLREHYGADTAHWTWGEHHVAAFQHLAFAGLPWLGRVLDVELPREGGRETVNLSGSAYDDVGQRYLAHTGPSFRAVYDLSDLERSKFVLSPGQSGHPLSRFYRDLSRLWAKGEYAAMTTARARVLAGCEGRLVLVPAAANDARAPHLRASAPERYEPRASTTHAEE